MYARRLMVATAMFGLAGFAACDANGADEDADIILQDTIIEDDVETVEIPLEPTDTAVVRTEVAVDTATAADTIDDTM